MKVDLTTIEANAVCNAIESYAYGFDEDERLRASYLKLADKFRIRPNEVRSKDTNKSSN